MGCEPCREDLDDPDTFSDDGVYCRSRSWLFLAYIVSFGAIMGSVSVLLQSYALNDAVDVVWPGMLLAAFPGLLTLSSFCIMSSKLFMQGWQDCFKLL